MFFKSSEKGMLLLPQSFFFIFLSISSIGKYLLKIKNGQNYPKCIYKCLEQYSFQFTCLLCRVRFNVS